MDGGPHHRALFVANSRNADRIVVRELADAGVDLALYGAHWERTPLPDGVWRADHVPNDQLPAYYAAADIVLNDTWPDMAAHGFISNRLYDAAAAGAFVLSDAVDGIEAEFDGGVVTFTDGADLRAKVRAYLDDPARRASHAAAARPPSWSATPSSIARTSSCRPSGRWSPPVRRGSWTRIEARPASAGRTG